MGLFNGLFGKKDNKLENAQLVNGFLIYEIESSYVNKMSDDEFDEVMSSSYTSIEPFLGSMDKTTMQELTDTLYAISPENYKVLLGYSIVLCWNRLLSVGQNAKYSHLVQEDALNTLNTLLDAIHSQIKDLLEQAN